MTVDSITRRHMLAGTAFGAVTALSGGSTMLADEVSAPVRVITRGPRHHWFGYYDKFEFDPTDRFVLGMEVDFEHRSPKSTDEIRIGMADLESGDRWIELGTSTAWGWQQGCMLQWIPGSDSRILWNDRAENHYVCRILDVKTKQRRTINHPIYTVSADGNTAVAPDFRRINDVRPGYGYGGLTDPYADDLAPKDTGIFRVDLRTGRHDLIISLSDIAGMGTIPRAEKGVKHYFNHLLFNPDGTRFIFLHRWRYPNGKRLTRMLTAKPDGSDIRIVDANGVTSHFIWRDERHILAWSIQPSHKGAFYLFEDGTSKIEVVGQQAMPRDGHCNYLPGGRWIVNDTYPDKDRHQEVYLYHPASDRKISLGRFHSPPKYTGEWRCDTHPRVSRNGQMIVIDAPHKNLGRQLHLIDISSIVG